VLKIANHSWLVNFKKAAFPDVISFSCILLAFFFILEINVASIYLFVHS